MIAPRVRCYIAASLACILIIAFACRAEHSTDDTASLESSPISKETSPATDRVQVERLVAAAESGNFNEVHRLIKAGVDVNSRDGAGVSALQRASNANHPKLAEFLIEHGADINARTSQGDTPLIFAANSLYNGTEPLIKILVERGAEVNAPGDHGVTALHLAARWGSIRAAEILLDHGASINVQDESGNTPLHYAAGSGQLQVLDLLMKRGAYVNAANSSGQTALEHAELDHPEAARFLVSHGADTHAKERRLALIQEQFALHRYVCETRDVCRMGLWEPTTGGCSQEAPQEIRDEHHRRTWEVRNKMWCYPGRDVTWIARSDKHGFRLRVEKCDSSKGDRCSE